MLSQVVGGDFLLFSITNELPLWRSSEQRPTWGYACNASKIPDLSQFCNLDFVMVAADFSWTMVYTHEDFGLGGPYFTERSWAEQPRDDSEQGNRRVRHRSHRS